MSRTHKTNSRATCDPVLTISMKWMNRLRLNIRTMKPPAWIIYSDIRFPFESVGRLVVQTTKAEHSLRSTD